MFVKTQYYCFFTNTCMRVCNIRIYLCVSGHMRVRCSLFTFKYWYARVCVRFFVQILKRICAQFTFKSRFGNGRKGFIRLVSKTKEHCRLFAPPRRLPSSANKIYTLVPLSFHTGSSIDVLYEFTEIKTSHA